MNKLVELFKRLTAYDHFTVFLIILSVLKIADVFADSGAAAGLHFMKLGAALLVISSGLFFGFKYLFDKKKKYQHALISTLLILLMLSHEDPDPVRGIMVILLLYVAKFFLKYQKQSIFNPVVFAIGATTLLAMFVPVIAIPPLDWSGIDIRYDIFGRLVPIAIVPILLSLYFNVGRIRKHPLALAFIFTSLLGGFLLDAYSENPASYILAMTFMGTAIIVEPKTSPHKRNEQLVFGILIALIILAFGLVPIPNAAMLGLLMGNVLFFLFKVMKKRMPSHA